MTKPLEDTFEGNEAGALRDLLAAGIANGDAGEALLPASPAQRRLWFLEQLQPGTARYNIPIVAWLTGELDVAALEEAYATVIQRHESLRSRFVTEDGEPVIELLPPGAFGLMRIEVMFLKPEQRIAAARLLIKEEVQRPFNLEEGPLTRATLLQLGPDEHIVIFNLHHIIFDEWSMKIFFKELAEVYTSRVRGVEPELPELAIQYSDFAAWHQEWLQSEECARQLEYWKMHLAGNPAPVQLAMTGERPRQRAGDVGDNVRNRFLPAELVGELRRLAAREGSTLFIVLLSALKLLLHRRTRQPDIIVGIPMAGRSQVETESVIGFFTNTLPLRTRMSEEMTCKQLLRRVREAAFGAYSHQEVPFEKIVEALQPGRAAGKMPFINVMFAFQTDCTFPELPGLRATVLDTGTDTTKTDLTFFGVVLENGVDAGFEYDTELFDAAFITDLLRELEEILRGMVLDSAQRLAEVRPPARVGDTPQSTSSWRGGQPDWLTLEEWCALRAAGQLGGCISEPETQLRDAGTNS